MKPNIILGYLSKYQLHEKKEIIKYEYNMDYSTFLIQDDVKPLKNDYNTEKPLAYILGYTTFLGNKILVNENTLIPRVESEEVIQPALNLLEDNMKVLDLCTGSGVLGISLKIYKNIELTCADISQEALKVCQKNLKLYDFEAKIIQGNMFENIQDKYDMIIFNPPYVDKAEKLEDSVYKYEPHLALFGENQGLEFYEKFFSVVEKYLTKNGIIILEIGDNQFYDIQKMMVGFKNIELIKDYFGRERGICATKC